MAADPVAALVEAEDRDRWLAALFIPEDKRADVLALLAFSIEVSRIRDAIREPMPGEIRLQWWADMLNGTARGDAGGHPVARALMACLDRHPIPRQGLLNLIEARRFDLYDDAMPTLTDLEGYCGETLSVLVQGIVTILTGSTTAIAADACGHFGCAYAMAGLMRAFPLQARRGQVFMPEDVLARHGSSADEVRTGVETPALKAAMAEMREHARHHLARATAAIARLPAEARPAFVGLALVEPYLKALEKAPLFGPPVDMARWRKPFALWRWMRRNR